MPVKMEIKGLNLTYRGEPALENISLEVEANRITAIIGPSGCGKSSFLRVLNRMNDLIPEAKVEGEVLLEGTHVYRNGLDPVGLRKRVGMVFQEPNPFPMSIYDNVAYGPRIHGVRDREQLDQIVQESLEAAHLWGEVSERLHTPALELSGGQQQRLCIARVLAVKPEVILLDEPTSALDPQSTAKIEDLLLRLKENYTIVIVTHNMQQAARISDVTAFFLNGELVEMGETGKVFKNPRDRRTEDYVTGRFG